MALLPESGIFDGFNAAQLEEIRTLGIQKQYDKGQNIFYEEDSSDGIYFILKGYVKVYQIGVNGTEKTLAILTPGDIIGEMATFGSHNRSASVKVIEPTDVLFIPTRRFEELLGKVPALGTKITEILTNRLRIANRQLALLGSGSSREKVVNQLLYLVERCGRAHGSGYMIIPRFTHLEMASLAGVARETVTKIYNDLEEKGVLSFEDRHIIVRSLDELQKEVN